MSRPWPCRWGSVALASGTARGISHVARTRSKSQHRRAQAHRPSRGTHRAYRRRLAGSAPQPKPGLEVLVDPRRDLRRCRRRRPRRPALDRVYRPSRRRDDDRLGRGNDLVEPHRPASQEDRPHRMAGVVGRPRVGSAGGARPAVCREVQISVSRPLVRWRADLLNLCHRVFYLRHRSRPGRCRPLYPLAPVRRQRLDRIFRPRPRRRGVRLVLCPFRTPDGREAPCVRAVFRGRSGRCRVGDASRRLSRRPGSSQWPLSR